eukprot:COSAG04_NODE_5368_length_1641_cov_0.991569_1_plen_142_part_00
MPPLCIFAAGPDGELCRNCNKPRDHEWHSVPDAGQAWTTRAILAYVIEAVAEGDESWHALWGEAYEQQLAALPSPPSSSAEEEILASLAVDAWPECLPVWCKAERCFRGDERAMRAARSRRLSELVSKGMTGVEMVRGPRL